MYFRKPDNMIVKDQLYWEPTMQLRWYPVYSAVRGISSMFVNTEPKIECEQQLQQLWIGKASAGAQTILMKEWRPVPYETETQKEI